MSCLDAEAIARAALGDAAGDVAAGDVAAGDVAAHDVAANDVAADDVAAHAHLASCLTCRRKLADDRAARDAIRRLPLPQLSASHRRELAAEILAAAHQLPPRRPRRRRHARALAAVGAAALATAAAAAAIAVFAVGRGAVRAERPMFTVFTSDVNSVNIEAVGMRSRSVAFVEPPPAERAPREVRSLADGNLLVDTRTTPDLDIRVGGSVIRVDDSAVRIQARRGKVISVQVIVGAAEIRTGAQRVRIERDSLWVAQPDAPARASVPTPAEDAPAAVPTGAQQAMATFRAAWLALRAGNNREAMELFDRVTDPVAREEALYWAAIAAERLGDADLARAHRAKLAAEFPQSSLGHR